MDKISISDLKFSPDGLIPAVIQDYVTGQVLMVAYMNEESLRKTFETGKTWFWSRKRKTLWLKGETSGHFQAVREVFVDCDLDTLLIKVEQTGVACHEGTFSCFYRKMDRDGHLIPIQSEAPVQFAPGPGATVLRAGDASGDATGAGGGTAILDEVYAVIIERKEHPSEESYTSRLMQSGLDRILRKIGEEAGEFIIASKNENDRETVAEIADLWFHSLVALAYLGIPVSAVYDELRRRRR